VGSQQQVPFIWNNFPDYIINQCVLLAGNMSVVGKLLRFQV